MTKEMERMEENRTRKAYWKRWGPYLSERQWGTVREDYSADGEAWEYLTHDMARSRAYRWGEDGIAGISDNHQRLCFALALWNGNDPILKERFFGLSGPEGNHGEDVKEYYWYLDNTPTHSFMKMLYKYPQQAFPYTSLVQENGSRGYADPEFELIDSGVFDGNRYFDIKVEYAKKTAEDILIRITATNRGPDSAQLYLLPTLWFRNTWSWGNGHDKPIVRRVVLDQSQAEHAVLEASHPLLGTRWLYCHHPNEVVFTENETNTSMLYGVEDSSPYVKDGIGNYLVGGARHAVNPTETGTKASALFHECLVSGQTMSFSLRLTEQSPETLSDPFGAEFSAIFAEREREADDFYADINPFTRSEDARRVQRQAFAGMLWNKQFYHYVVQDWLEGDPNTPAPSERYGIRNGDWVHFYSEDILSMPDTWEYPWFAAWDSAFHAIPLAMIDPEFAKQQLNLFTREWYMHPNGQIPAYEWNFSDVNPPVHAWAAWRVYKIEKKRHGRGDRVFLERIFQKLLLNFTWWVNRKDDEGRNIFQGGFLGLDNIGVFNRSAALPTGGHLHQSDSTSWMAMYCLNMLAISLELAEENRVYEDIASKFYEHFLYIADAMHGKDSSMWDEEDGFYYDQLHTSSGIWPLRIHSLVGLIPLLAVTSLEPDSLERFPHFAGRMSWFMEHREDLNRNVACMRTEGVGQRRLLSVVNRDRLVRILKRVLDEGEFLSPYGIRSVSKFHADHPYRYDVDGTMYEVDYEPAESTSGMFGGNSNWRGPIWFPINYLLIEALQKFHHYYGDDLKVEYPTGSGRYMNLWDVASDLSHRLTNIFLADSTGSRPVFAGVDVFESDPHWKDLVLFHEYFHGDTGVGLGASHQTGWTGLVAKLIEQCDEYCR